MTDKKRLLIAAAGTGGHVMPGLAVARVLKEQGWEIHWLGTKTGMESGLVARDAFEFTGLDFKGLRGRGVFGLVSGGFKLVRAIFSTISLMKSRRIDAVFSTGGYIAVPAALAAKALGRPLVLMNCDADLLMSTKMTLKYADKMACGFDGSARSYAGDKGVATGNPVRRDILEVQAPEERFAGRSGPLKLFVFGGSLGARVLNENLPKALALIPEQSRPFVYHQTGKGRDEAVRRAYEELGVQAEVMPFVDDMASLYAETDAVVCRAGATSVSEICAAGAAACLVPFVAKTTSHQLGNARYMHEQGAAFMIEENDATVERLAEFLSKLDRRGCLEKAVKARSLARSDAAEKVAELIVQAEQNKDGK